MAKGEALDSVRDERPFAGVHILATALLCAAGSTTVELELARRILQSDPRTDAPRESESVAGAFNRHMDAAIDSVNASTGDPTRAGRRARLAADLGRADLVLMDRAMVAALMVKIGELKHELAAKAANPLFIVPGVPPAANGERLWTDGDGNLFTGENGTIPINLKPGGVTYGVIDGRGQVNPIMALAADQAAAGGIDHHEIEDDRAAEDYGELAIDDSAFEHGLGDYSNPNVND